MNNEVLDTYQLKSLDGLLEAQVENLAVVQREEASNRKSAGKTGKKKKRLYVTLKKYIQEQNSSEVTGEELPGYYQDNYSMRKPYDRVIRCLGFRFNFSIFDRYGFLEYYGLNGLNVFWSVDEVPSFVKGFHA